MPLVANEQTLDAVNAVNVKNLMELHSLTAGLSGQNQLAQQQRVNEIANANMHLAFQSAQQLAQLAGQQALQLSNNGAMLAQAMTGRVTRHLLDLSAEQAVAFSKEIAADLSSKMEDFGSTLSSIEQFAKIGASTPPQTGTGGAFGSESNPALLQTLANIQAVLQSLSERVK